MLRRHLQCVLLSSLWPWQLVKEMESRICKRCDAELLPDNFYNSNKGVCRKCYIMAVQQKRKKEMIPDEEDVELGVVEILDPETRDDLYIMKNSRLPDLKVGRSHNPDARAKDLSSCQPFKIHVLHVYKGKGYLEATVHQRLKIRKVTEGEGREWFKLDLETLKTIIEGVLAESSLTAFSP